MLDNWFMAERGVDWGSGVLGIDLFLSLIDAIFINLFLLNLKLYRTRPDWLSFLFQLMSALSLLYLSLLSSCRDRLLYEIFSLYW